MIHPTPLFIKVQKLVNEVSIPDICNLSDPSQGHFGLREKRIYLFTQDTVYFYCFWSCSGMRRGLISQLDYWTFCHGRHSTADRG